MRRSRTAWLAAIVAAAGLTAEAQSGQARALELYNAAARESNPSRQVELLRGSLQALETYEGSIALADVLLRSGGDPLESRRLCTRAFENLITPGMPQEKPRMATALVCLARTYRATNERGMASVILKRSLELERLPVAEQELREVLDGGFKPADTIAKELNAGMGRDAKGVGVPRGAVPTAVSADLYVNFEFDSATLTSDGARQVAELARALDLIGKDVSRRRVVVVGHTDMRGTDEYNLTLSRRRAQAVADLLAARYQVARDTLSIEGLGKRRPLLSGDTEADHALNRRVEVQVAP